MNPRTNVDWSKHKLIIRECKYVTIYEFAIPGQSNNKVVFSSLQNVLLVTGDRFNWVLERISPPSKEIKKAYDSHWISRLKQSSHQEGMKFDREGTKKQIQEERALLEQEEEPDTDILEFLYELDSCVEDAEFIYDYVVYTEKPSHLDFEAVPKNYEIIFDFQVVMDAYEQCCEHLRKQAETILAEEQKLDPKLLNISYYLMALDRITHDHIEGAICILKSLYHKSGRTTKGEMGNFIEILEQIKSESKL